MRYLLLALLPLAAQAATFTFWPATDGSHVCTNYCVGYTTSDPLHSVSYINVTVASPYAPTQYKVTVQIDGVYLVGTSPASTVATVPFLVTDGVNNAMITVFVPTTRTCTHSGRAQHCTVRYFPDNGSVSQ